MKIDSFLLTKVFQPFCGWFSDTFGKDNLWLASAAKNLFILLAIARISLSVSSISNLVFYICISIIMICILTHDYYVAARNQQRAYAKVCRDVNDLFWSTHRMVWLIVFVWYLIKIFTRHEYLPALSLFLFTSFYYLISCIPESGSGVWMKQKDVKAGAGA